MEDFILNVYGGIYEDGLFKIEIVYVDDVSFFLICLKKSWVVVDRENFFLKLLVVVLLKEEGVYLVI